MLKRVAAKARQVVSFCREAERPFDLILDTIGLKRTPFVASMKGGLKLQLAPNSGESFTFYENLIRRDYLTRGITLGPGDTVVDVGANIGAFSILAASIVGPTGRVIAFEPMPETFERLCANVKLNGLNNVECLNAAIDAREGVITMRSSKKSAYASAHQVNSDHLSRDEETTCPCLTIERAFDECGIDHINLLKIDCEGSEYGIIATLDPGSAARIDQIAMEVHPVRGESAADLRQSISALGFEVDAGYPWVAVRRASA